MVAALIILALSLLLAWQGLASSAAFVTLVTAAVGAVTGASVNAFEKRLIEAGKITQQVEKPTAEHALVLGIFVVVVVATFLGIISGDQALELSALLVTYILARATM